MSGHRRWVLAAGAILLVASLLLSIVFGAAGLALPTVLKALFAFDPGQSAHLIVQELRLPRAVAAALVGASLGTAGALMQGMTRNPLASPSLMGLSAGAGLLLAIGLASFPHVGLGGFMILSFAGATLGAALVYGIGSAHPGGLEPVRLALAGAAVSALLGALTSVVVIYHRIAQDVLFYVAGGVQGVQWSQLSVAGPVMLVGIVCAVAISGSVSLLSLGNNVAVGLGQDVRRARIWGTIATLLLASSAVALAGGVGFIGLVVPHIVRFTLGLDYRWIIPGSAIFGALLLVWADLLARMINPPYETPVGLVTALIGVPFFLYLARRDGRGI